MDKLSKREQERIKGLLVNGKSQRQAASECGVSLGVVNKIAKAIKELEVKNVGEMDDLAKEASKAFAPVPSATLENEMLTMLREMYADKEPERLSHLGGGCNNIMWQVTMYANRTGRYQLLIDAREDGSLRNAMKTATNEGWLFFVKAERPEWVEWIAGKGARECATK